MSENEVKINLNSIFRGIFSYYKLIFSSILIAFVVSISLYSNKIKEDKFELHLSSDKIFDYEKIDSSFDGVEIIDLYKKIFKNNFIYVKNLDNYLDKKYKDVNISYFYNLKKISLKSYLKQNKIKFNFNSTENQKFSNFDNSNYLFSISMNFPSELDFKEFIISYIKFIHEITSKELLNNLHDNLVDVQNKKKNIKTMLETENISEQSKLYLINFFIEEDLINNLISLSEKNFNNININQFYEFTFLINEFSMLSHIVRMITLVLFLSILFSFLFIYFNQNIKIKI